MGPPPMARGVSRLLFTLLVSVVAAGLTGCLPRPPLLHVPDPHPTPLLTAAGDARVTVGGIIAPLEGDNVVEALGGEMLVEGHVQATVSPIDHVGVFGSASHVSEPEHTHGYAEAGAVVYGRLSEALRGELLVGGGRGDVEGEGTYYAISTSLKTYTATAELERAFAQANVWWVQGRTRLGFSLRASRVRFFETEGMRRPREAGGSFRATYLEPGLFVRSGHRPVSVGARLALAVPVDEPHGDGGDEVYRSRPFSLGVGLTLDLGHLFGTAAD